jgi:hypothetical protein
MRLRMILTNRYTILIGIAILAMLIIPSVGIYFNMNSNPDGTPTRTTPVVPSIIVSVSHSPSTVYPDDIVTITATYSLTTLSEKSDNQFVTANDVVEGFYYINGDSTEHIIAMTLSGGVYIGHIPAYSAGTTIRYKISFTVNGASETSQLASYLISYVPEAPKEENPTQPGFDYTNMTNPQNRIPPGYMINNVILTTGENITWQEFMTAKVWGTIHMSITFLEGGNRIWAVSLLATRTDDYGSGTWYWGVSETDMYTWEFDWDTTQMSDGNYVMDLHISYWIGDTPPPAGGGTENVMNLAYSMFAFGGLSGNISMVSDYAIIGIIFVIAVFSGCLLYFGYEKNKNVRKRKWR